MQKSLSFFGFQTHTLGQKLPDFENLKQELIETFGTHGVQSSQMFALQND